MGETWFTEFVQSVTGRNDVVIDQNDEMEVVEKAQELMKDKTLVLPTVRFLFYKK